MKYVYDRWGEIVDSMIGDLPIAETDVEAYSLYPQYEFLFNKLKISQDQKIECAPHGVPWTLPRVFSKPIYNLMGLSAGTQIIEGSYDDSMYIPGHFWMPVLEGKQRSWDVLVVDGEIVWSYVMYPEKNEKGSFITWHTDKDAVYSGVAESVADFIYYHLNKYSGSLTVETIGDTLIECTPRMASQFIDFYGKNYLKAVVEVHTKNTFAQDMSDGLEGVSQIVRVPKFYGHLIPFVKDLEKIKELEKEVYSIYLPWYENKELQTISDDPYSYRLAVINAPEVNMDIESKIREQIGFK